MEQENNNEDFFTPEDIGKIVGYMLYDLRHLGLLNIDETQFTLELITKVGKVLDINSLIREKIANGEII